MKPVNLIVAIDRRGAIGNNGDLVFHFREDLRRFKRITTGNTVIMGRRTWESLPGALQGRLNIVISRNLEYKADGATVVQTLDDALALAENAQGEPFIMGGAAIYALAAPLVSKLHITVVNDIAPEADTYIAPIDLDKFRAIAAEPCGKITFHTLVKID